MKSYGLRYTGSQAAWSMVLSCLKIYERSDLEPNYGTHHMFFPLFKTTPPPECETSIETVDSDAGFWLVCWSLPWYLELQNFTPNFLSKNLHTKWSQAGVLGDLQSKCEAFQELMLVIKHMSLVIVAWLASVLQEVLLLLAVFTPHNVIQTRSGVAVWSPPSGKQD